jgi:hypothetical protein
MLKTCLEMKKDVGIDKTFDYFEEKDIIEDW